jgi:hypothetical protein
MNLGLAENLITLLSHGQSGLAGHNTMMETTLIKQHNLP